MGMVTKARELLLDEIAAGKRIELKVLSLLKTASQIKTRESRYAVFRWTDAMNQELEAIQIEVDQLRLDIHNNDEIINAEKNHHE